MQNLFTICFYTGLLFTLVTFFLGEVFHFLNFDLHLPGGSDFHLGTDSADDGGVSPIKPVVIALFITIFGGIGLIGVKAQWIIGITVLLAVIIALIISYLFFRYVIVALHKKQTFIESRADMIGKPAKLKLAIKDNGFGEISYSVNGSMASAPARSIHGRSIPVDTEVMVVKIEDDTFWVIES